MTATLEQYFAATYQKRQFIVAGEHVTSALANPPAAMLTAEAAALTSNIDVIP